MTDVEEDSLLGYALTMNALAGVSPGDDDPDADRKYSLKIALCIIFGGIFYLLLDWGFKFFFD